MIFRNFLSLWSIPRSALFGWKLIAETSFLIFTVDEGEWEKNWNRKQLALIDERMEMANFSFRAIYSRCACRDLLWLERNVHACQKPDKMVPMVDVSSWISRNIHCKGSKHSDISLSPFVAFYVNSGKRENWVTIGAGCFQESSWMKWTNASHSPGPPTDTNWKWKENKTKLNCIIHDI